MCRITDLWLVWNLRNELRLAYYVLYLAWGLGGSCKQRSPGRPIHIRVLLFHRYDASKPFIHLPLLKSHSFSYQKNEDFIALFSGINIISLYASEDYTKRWSLKVDFYIQWYIPQKAAWSFLPCLYMTDHTYTAFHLFLYNVSQQYKAALSFYDVYSNIKLDPHTSSAVTDSENQNRIS